MSRQYKLVFGDSDVMWHVIDSLKSSDACIKAQAQGVCLKNRELQTLAEYDVRLIQDGDRSVWLEVNFRSPNLCNLMQEALGNAVVRCFEDGDFDDEVTLKDAFRIKANNSTPRTA
ncbi:hypothetical protein [Burkholderia ubonensis]|uniref:hypothetical protein n=1 Tax=Burkholderia ubonensis TaxID=101571 RepID=UPI0009B49F47|nr:hypothetical protein [Burkholderia ubonensis]